MGRIYLDDRRM